MDADREAASIAAILVVDQVGSTRFNVAHGDDVATRVAEDHLDVTRTIVRGLGGVLEKSTGDGAIASFPLGTDALDAAVEIQRAVERLSVRYPEPVAVRVGIAVGEVHRRDDDLRGWPLFLATRLCDAADDGAILASKTLVDMMAASSRHPLGRLQELELRGLDAPTAAWEVEWRLASEGADVPLDPELGRIDERPWCGRQEQLSILRDAVLATDAPRLLAITGEPGAGKTRLLARFAAECSRNGHLVLYGAAVRESRSSYAPLVAALRSVLGSLDRDVVASLLAGNTGRELARLLPELRTAARGDVNAVEGVGAQRLLTEALSNVLSQLSSWAGGLTLVVDDLQWADELTMAALRLILGPSGPRGVTVIAVTRSTDPDAPTEFFADVARRNEFTRIDLGGLPVGDIAALIAEARPGLDDEEVAEAAESIHSRTAGNALFVTSLVEDPDWGGPGATSDELALSNELDTAIRERLARFDDDDLAALSIAAVIGQRFEAATLGEVADLDPRATAALLARARRAGIVQDVGGGIVAFSHDLVRIALLPPVDSYERSATHRTIADAMAADASAEPDVVADHYLASLHTRPDPADVVRWCRSAAEKSTRQLAYLEAAGYHRGALDVLRPDDERRPALLVELGKNQRFGGDPDYRTTLLAAVDESLAAGRPDLAAQAALANNRGLYSSAGAVDQGRIDALDRVLREDHPAEVRSELLATLAVERVFEEGDADALDTLSLDAVALGRKSGDRDALIHALSLRQDTNYRIDNVDTRLAETDELMALTVDAAPVSRFWAVAHRTITVGEVGRWDEVASLVDEAAAIASSTRRPVLEWYASLLRAAHEIQIGELREAQRIIDRGYELGMETQQPDALILTSGQQCEVLRRRGRYDTIHELAETNLSPDLLRRSAPMRAVLFLEDGREDRAFEVWESVGLDGALDVPNAQVGHNLLHARRVCEALGDDEALARIETLLAGVPPYLFCNYWEPTAPAPTD